MREFVGRILCFGLGLLYSAGAVPLFTFGKTADQLWAQFEHIVGMLANGIGIAPWLATTILGFFAIGGPLALVWVIAGRGVNRTMWFVGGVIAYAGLWVLGLSPLGL